jgi:hypothetical protein
VTYKETWRFWIGNWICWTHRLQLFLLQFTVGLSPILNYRIQFTTDAPSPLGLLSHTSPLAPAPNVVRSPFLVSELFSLHSNSYSLLTVHLLHIVHILNSLTVSFQLYFYSYFTVTCCHILFATYRVEATYSICLASNQWATNNLSVLNYKTLFMLWITSADSRLLNIICLLFYDVRSMIM